MHHIGSWCPGRHSILPLLFPQPLSGGHRSCLTICEQGDSNAIQRYEEMILDQIRLRGSPASCAGLDYMVCMFVCYCVYSCLLWRRWGVICNAVQERWEVDYVLFATEYIHSHIPSALQLQWLVLWTWVLCCTDPMKMDTHRLTGVLTNLSLNLLFHCFALQVQIWTVWSTF